MTNLQLYGMNCVLKIFMNYLTNLVRFVSLMPVEGDPEYICPEGRHFRASGIFSSIFKALYAQACIWPIASLPKP